MNRIEELRKKQKMSKTELAKRAGVSRTIIWGLESGKQKVTTTATLRKIAEALDASVSDIFF